MSHANNSIGAGTKISALVISIFIPLAASSLQAGRFFQELGQGSDRYVMLFTAMAIIFSSVVMGTLAGFCWGKGHVGGFALAAFVWMGITGFSSMTSTLAILNSSGNKIQTQISSHSNNVAMDSQIAANMKAIAGYQAQIDGRDPVRWAAKRTAWGNEIQSLSQQNMQLMSMKNSAANDGVGSPVAQSFKKLEKYGITRTGIAILAAMLLDAIPFTASVLLSLLLTNTHQRIKEKKKPAKKPQASR